METNTANSKFQEFQHRFFRDRSVADEPQAPADYIKTDAEPMNSLEPSISLDSNTKEAAGGSLIKDSISKLSKKIGVNNDSMLSLFSRKGSCDTTASSVNQSVEQVVSTNPLAKLQSWSKRLSSNEENVATGATNRSRSNSTINETSFTSLPRKVSPIFPFKKKMPSQQQQKHHNNYSYSRSSSISLISDQPLHIPTQMPSPTMNKTVVSKVSCSSLSMLIKPPAADTIDIADEYFSRNRSMPVNKLTNNTNKTCKKHANECPKYSGCQDSQVNNLLQFNFGVSPVTVHSCQFGSTNNHIDFNYNYDEIDNSSQHKGWVLHHGVLVSNDDLSTSLYHETNSVGSNNDEELAGLIAQDVLNKIGCV